MLLSEKIATSESKYKKILEDFFISIYSATYLPSHGIDHHRRVWHYAKEILDQLNNHNFVIDQSLTDRLIIACYLHDSGMAVDPGIRHGTEGKKFCERFLRENNLLQYDFTDVLQTIENHDNKEYTVINRPDELQTILSVADDLDAFGFIGIYRYLEIYIKRNKPPLELGSLITANCENRFNNFLATYGFLSLLAGRHSGRYEILNSYFKSYNEQSAYYRFDNKQPAGYCGVAEIIKQLPGSIYKEANIFIRYRDYPDPVIQWFFAELELEFSEFR
jgi:HD superfamily phosphodiesterase